MQVVWFKRDLRVRDHRPLVAASRAGEPVLCLYVYEPGLWAQDDADARHLQFIDDSLVELRENLRVAGSDLTLRVGELPHVLAEIHAASPITRLLSHEETGTLWTFERDKRVVGWCRQHGVEWKEFTQNGVIRRLKVRDGWAKAWHRRMDEPLQPAPSTLHPATGFSPGHLASAAELPLSTEQVPQQIQRGGESRAHDILKSFLSRRGHSYHKEMSSPVTAWDSCSRLSAHLAWGTISLAYVWQTLQRRTRQLRAGRDADSPTHRSWLTAVEAFAERLHWHCHFIQKLEDQPDLEDVNMHRACDGLRPEEPDKRLLQAWIEGQTGYPLVDACMRSVRETGWLTFRMRAMVVSFASYHLWLDWRPTSRYLARMFTDYEPGIHYNQFQMQSGTTGISTLRIYNPIKQVADHDPAGTFIRQWVRELANVPGEHLAEPHRMPLETQQQAGCLIGRDYPHPVVDHVKASTAARKRMQQIRRQANAREEAQRVFVRHGSRRGPRRR